MNPNVLADEAVQIAQHAIILADQLRALAAAGVAAMPPIEPAAQVVAPFIYLFSIFLMACFVGYYVVWNVTPALHSPLMGVTNAISSVIVVGAILAVGLGTSGWATGFGFIAVLLASVNIFGGFAVVQRMLSMFQARKAVRQ